MPSLDTVEHTIPCRVLITGLPGSGKSTLAAMLATHGFLLDWFDLENAGDTLKKLPQEVKKNIKYMRIPDSAAFPVASQTLMQIFKAGKGTLCVSHGVVACQLCKRDSKEFDTVDFSTYSPRNVCVVDTVTQLGYSILSHLTKNKPVDYKPERDDWGGLRKFTEFFASQFQAFPGNLIVIAHLIETTMADDRTKLVPNFGSAAMSAALAKAFSHVVYMETVNRQHKAYSSSIASNNFLTKSRTDWEIEKLDKPSLFPLFAPMLEIQPMRAESQIIEGSATVVFTEPVQLQNPIPVEEVKNNVPPSTNAMSALKAKYGSNKMPGAQ